MEKRKWTREEVWAWMEQHGTPTFYYNKNDTNIIVRKRNIGIGWTLNAANPRAHALVVGIILVVLLIPAFVDIFS